MSDSDEDTHGQGVAPSTFPPISQQVRAHQVRTGDSQHDVSRRSERVGPRVSQRYIGDLRNGKAREWPRKASTFAGLAHAIETTPLAVVLGYAAEFGVPVTMSEFATRLPPRVDELGDDVKESVLRLLWSLTGEGVGREHGSVDDLPDLTGDRPEGPDVVADESPADVERGEQQ